MKTKRIIPLLLAAVMTLTACGSQTSGSESSTQQTAPVGVAVQVQPVEVKEISTDNRVSGKVVSDNEHTIMVATTAKCTAVYVQAGDTVEAGDVSNNLLPLGSLIFVIFCCNKRFGWGWDNFLAEANAGKGLKVKNWMKPIFCFVVPVAIVIIYVMGLINFSWK